MTDETQTPGPPRIELRQDTETPLTTLSTPFGSVLYLYARSSDSVSAATIGQDYVAFRFGEHDLAFAVCDGVGQSFMGDLAARVLGNGLVDWLWEAQKPAGEAAFAQAVTQALNALTQSGAQVVADFRLPEGLPPILVQALENQRKYGSESMFVAGRIALAPPDPWIALCWLGDSPVAAIDIDGRLVDLGPHGHTSERWNAATGVKGEVHTWVGSAERVARVAGYTDGLAVEHVPTDADLARMMEHWLSSPPADDAALFDVRLAPSPQTTGQEKPPAPEELALPAFEADLERPIVIDETPRTPVREVQPIEARAADETAVEGWRPLVEQPAAPEAAPPAAAPAPPEALSQAAEMLSALSSQALGLPASMPPALDQQQQMAMWQQAALLGLTSAALAMLMMERLMRQQVDKG